MRSLCALLLLLSACDGCGGGGLHPADSAVRADAEVRVGRVYVGESGTAFFGVTATRAGPVALLGASTDHPELALRWEGGDGTRIPGGTTLAVRVEWTPRAPGALDARIAVRTDVEGSERLEVRASGEALALPDCDDGNPCTDDVFDRPAERCTHAQHERGCDDGNACTQGDRCSRGECLGVARDCGDDDVCTLDLCDPARGCVHPPDPRTCDDRDPCTLDVCDPDDGCTHPDAPDGTACGAFSCAQASLCVFGRCRALDVTGLSDGLPCFDGDLCTDPDTCRAGACTPGPAIRREPSVAAAFETFGGENALPATDGYRYLFAERNRIVVAVRESDTALRRTATLPVGSSVPPVFFAPGRLVAARDDRIFLVDVSDPAAPRVAWEAAVHTDLSGGPIEQLVRVRGGVVVAQPLPTDMPRSVLVFVPISEGAAPAPGAPVDLAVVELLDDLAADGDVLAATTHFYPLWIELAPDGQARRRVASEAVIGGNSRRVSVRGRRLATAGDIQTQVLEIDPGTEAPLPCDGSGACQPLLPGCAGAALLPGSYRTCRTEDPPCPTGARCAYLAAQAEGETCASGDFWCCTRRAAVCVSGAPPSTRVVATIPTKRATDVVLDEHWLYWSGPEGIEAVAIEGTDGAGDGGAGTDGSGADEPGPRRARVDFMPAQRLERGPFHLLASGPVALPFAMRGTAQTQPNQLEPVGLVRVTGDGHGDMIAATMADATHVTLAGRAAVGRIDLVAAKYTSALTVSASGPARPRLLGGPAHRTVVDDEVDEDPWDAYVPGSLETPGAPVELIDAAGAQSRAAPLGMHGGSLDVACGRLWSSTSEWAPMLTQSVAPSHLRAWALDPLVQTPQLDRLLVVDHVWWPPRLRGADDGTGFALFERGYGATAGTNRIRLFGCGDPAYPEAATLAVPPTDRYTSKPARDLFGFDGPLVLAADDNGFALHAAASGAGPLARWDAPVTSAMPSRTRVPWMARGRAWVAWSDVAAGAPADSLAELAYSAAGALAAQGTVSLPAPARRVFDAGPAALVTTDRAVLVVLPACR